MLLSHQTVYTEGNVQAGGDMSARVIASKKSVSAKNDKSNPAARATATKKPAVKRGIAGAKVAAKAGTAAKAGVIGKPGKAKKVEKKVKVVRDSFTMPQSDYAKIAQFKEICLKNGMHVKKSEVLRAGLQALEKLNAAQLKKALAALEPIKTGRPKKS
jgi:hypothetical protein